MKNLKLLLFGMLAFTIIFNSCKKETYVEPSNENSDISTLTDEFSNNELEILSKLDKDHYISIDIAKEVANNVMYLFDSENSLKSAKTINRSISNTRTIWFKPNISQLKSGNIESNDSLALYVFNFADNNNDSLGYAIVSGDDRLQSVLGCSDSGTLNDTVSNPGLTVFLSHTPDYIESKIVEYELNEQEELNSAIAKLNAQLPDSIRAQLEQQDSSSLKSTNGLFLRWVPTGFSYGAWQRTTQHGPLLTVEWGQWSPYNNNVSFTCTDNWTGHAPTGCHATAAAQIMAFHQHPASFDGVTYNWANMTSSRSGWSVPTTARNQIAILFAEIGQNMNMDYGCDGSGASRSEANSCYNTMRYSTDGVKGYDLNTIVSCLSNRRPLHIAAHAIKETKTSGWWIFKSTTTSYKEGHAWVIDGYVKRRRLVSYTMNLMLGSRIVSSHPVSYYQYDEYVHCNYGWSGTDNGYYVSGAFDTNTGATTLKSGVSGYYQYNIEMIPNIRPN